MFTKELLQRCARKEKENAKKYKEMGLPAISEDAIWKAEFFESMIPKKNDRGRLF